MKKKSIIIPMQIVSVLLFALFLAPKSAHAFIGLNGRIAYRDADSARVTTVLPDGSQQKTWTSIAVDDFRIAPTGERIVYTTPPGELAIHTANIDGSNDQQLYDIDDVLFTPTWSPTGSEIAFMKENATYNVSTMNNDGTSINSISANYSIEPDWSPDGSKILYTGSDGDTEIYVMDRDGSNVVKLTDNATYDWNPRWSPDGTKILYRTSAGAYNQIYVMDPDGSNKTALTSTSAHNYYPAWSPDGSKITFSRLEASQYNLYVASADGSNAAKIVDDIAFGSIDWQPLVNTPSSNTPNKSIETNANGVATIDVASMYTDPYDGVDADTLAITSEPSNGSAAINNGVVTYTQDQTAQSGFWNQLFAFFMPAAHAQTANDTFDYQICSQTNSQLCASGTISVVLGASTNSSSSPSELADTGISAFNVVLIGAAIVTTALVLNRKKQNTAS